jgi:hypothetical protein
MKYRPEFPARFGSYEDASGFCREFFGWYNEDHYHEGVGMLTPATVHYGRAEQVLAARHQVLQAAYAKHPERFVRGCPQRQQPPVAVWINPPERTAQDDQKRPPATNWARRPEASRFQGIRRTLDLAIPWRVAQRAELASVSPGTIDSNARPAVLQPPLNTRAMPEKIPGVRGLAPGEAAETPTAEKMLH